MFFFLSKVLTFLVSPMVWFFAILIWALKTKDEKRKKKLLISALALIYVSCNSFFVDELARAWEPVTPDYYLSSEKYDVAIVLGGIGSIDERQNRLDFGAGGDRLFQTLDLFHKGRIKQIMFTGGSGSIRFPTHKEGLYVKKYLNTIHIPDSLLIIENESKNTFENASFSKKILDSLKFNGSVLLVTSAFHMPRSLATFKKAGFTNVTPYLTNRMSGPRRFDWDHCFLPNAEALSNLNMLIHEWIGYLAYKIKGYA
ncbi:MAG: YdcF family protein [Sphingobacteriaceae bacterium]|nr:YdcF family protein [Sphingobacteriaceae bacterium]